MPTKNAVAIGARLRIARMMSRQSLTDAGSQAGLTEDAMRDIESGSLTPGPAVRARLCLSYGVSWSRDIDTGDEIALLPEPPSPDDDAAVRQSQNYRLGVAFNAVRSTRTRQILLDLVEGVMCEEASRRRLSATE